MSTTTMDAFSRQSWNYAKDEPARRSRGYSNLFNGAALFAGMVASALQVGTGGAATASYYRERGAMGYSAANYAARTPEVADLSEPSSAENLTHILETLRPTVTELARVLGVSRQAIYDWKSGSSITVEHSEKLADLARAARVFASEGLTASHQILRRKISGRSFFDRVKDGESAEASANVLLGVARRELEQRRTLQARLGGRINSVEPDDVGIPHLSEQG